MIRINDLVLGEGKPKICVPMIGTSKEQILKEAVDIASHKVDIAEWRLDLYEDVLDTQDVLSFIKKVKTCLSDTLLLCTFRTAREGGSHDSISEDEYFNLNKALIKSRAIDLIDLELFMDKLRLKELISSAHIYGLHVILSNHDFHETPRYDELMTRLMTMQRLGGDILKIAVMPQTKHDLLTLLQATLDMNEKVVHQAIVSISMGQLGMLSRICGELFGSAITFASLNGCSAPGQLPYDDLETVLNILHQQISSDT